LKPRKRKTKFYTFLLVPDNEKQTKSFKIKSSVLRLTILSIVVIVILIAFGFFSYLKFAGVLIDYSNLKKENAQLKEGLNKIDQLKSDLEVLKKSDKKLRTSLKA
jgi:cell division protein FtsB